MGGIWSSFYQVSHGLMTFHMSCLMPEKVQSTTEARVSVKPSGDLASERGLIRHSRALILPIRGRCSVYFFMNWDDTASKSEKTPPLPAALHRSIELLGFCGLLLHNTVQCVSQFMFETLGILSPNLDSELSVLCVAFFLFYLLLVSRLLC